MKKFKFKLQAVLDFRLQQLDEAQQAYAKEEFERQKLLQRIGECDQCIDQALLDQRNKITSGPLDIFQAQQFPQFILRLKQQRAEEFQKLQVQEEIVMVRRAELKEANIKKRSLELLKQKAQKAFDNKVLKMEEETLAEIALNKIARRIQSEQHLSSKRHIKTA